MHQDIESFVCEEWEFVTLDNQEMDEHFRETGHRWDIGGAGPERSKRAWNRANKVHMIMGLTLFIGGGLLALFSTLAFSTIMAAGLIWFLYGLMRER